MTVNDLITAIQLSVSFKKLTEIVAANKCVSVSRSTGSHTALLAAAMAQEKGGVHLMIMDNRDDAGYLYNDLYGIAGDRTFFFPTAYKKSIEFGQLDHSGVVQRTALMESLLDKNNEKEFTLICSYPEAIAEMVAGREELANHTLTIKKGDRIDLSSIAEILVDQGFGKVDFVYEPGQFSLRGGIFDVFSYSANNPYRIDMFDTDVESIRIFDINTQRSVKQCERVDIIPNIKVNGMISLLSFLGESKTVWVNDVDYTVRRIGEVARKTESDQVVSPQTIKDEFLGTQGLILLTAPLNFMELQVSEDVEFKVAPQPSFNKNFNLLADHFAESVDNGYHNFIVTQNKAQVERLENIFNSIGQDNIKFRNISADFHKGFSDNELKFNIYTDHQIFERHHKYALRGEVVRSEAMTLNELSALKVGDYVVHIDHGVGRFGGLVRTTENGKVTETIKLVYRDNDVLLVNVHSMHKISKYKDKDAVEPKIYKLGSGAWQRLKQTTKAKVKDIAAELIALYAKRKASKGFAFSHDSYMQNELEASFMYEDTPDQEKATKAVKEDMELGAPMDRLVCGDVGFGKTEIAMRAAFKAACDSKQVAVLVPTTMLSLQHYRSFTKRFKEFPVRVEHLSRAKSAKQTKEVLADLEAGRIDILIGTHKILSNSVKFKDLGLLIIDEEQKFGVSSKEKLRQMKSNVDTLTLTATPIPRTLQFSLMGSRDLSIISTPPPNRQAVETQIHLFDKELIRESINHELARGGQVYFLHNRVQSILSIKSVIQEMCPDARVAVGHGQMNPEELEKLMMDFIYGEYDVLVATTIIESGIDIPNANTIIINNGHMFGLSDLHQLRGRVGRSNRKAYCYILTPPDESLTDDARRRLRAIEDFSDLGAGFNLAMQDLDIRGAGNILGGEQSGFIADMGFETYQKILSEAMMELRQEQHLEAEERGENEVDENGQPIAQNKKDQVFISDCVIETDRTAMMPDSYVSSTKEKIILYRDLDNMSSEEALGLFETMLKDRFGEIPQATLELLDIVRMRWLAIPLGFEKILMKNGIMIIYFIADQKSAYYKTEQFGKLLQHVIARAGEYTFKQYNNKLQISVKNITSSQSALKILEKLTKVVKEG